MKNIDFLPERYKQRETLRQARVWWCAVVLIFGSAIGLAASAQFLMRQRIQRQIDELIPEYAAAQKQARELADLQNQIAKAGRSASLFTFLEDPWPRTQILAELVRPLPETIRLTQIHIGEEEAAMPSAPQAGPRRRGGHKEEEEGPKLSPAEEDLKQLRTSAEHRQTIVDLEGHTQDVKQLHQYVADIGASSLVASAQIKSLEVAPDGQKAGRTNFALRVVVRPGYAASSAAPQSPGSTRTETTSATSPDARGNERLARGEAQP